MPVFLGLPQVDMLLLTNDIVVRISSSNDWVHVGL